MKKRTWVLDTETKGTGAQMVPLEKVLEDPSARSAPLFVPRKRRPKPEPPPEPKPEDAERHDDSADARPGGVVPVQR